jgi:hypothetical protein
MPMIDIYAAAGTFSDVKKLASDAAALVKSVEQVPDVPMFRKNTAAFVHEMPSTAISNMDGDANYVRVQAAVTSQWRIPSLTPSPFIRPSASVAAGPLGRESFRMHHGSALGWIPNSSRNGARSNQPGLSVSDHGSRASFALLVADGWW